jgi:hypothetical protein
MVVKPREITAQSRDLSNNQQGGRASFHLLGHHGKPFDTSFYHLLAIPAAVRDDHGRRAARESRLQQFPLIRPAWRRPM